MSPRDRRLLSDLTLMEELASQGAVTFRTERYPPDEYHLMLSGLGLAKDERGRLVVRRLHRCSVYLHLDYPRRPPVAVWQTPVFHPNLLGPERNGGVCIGSWSAAESLADLCRRLLGLVTYRSFNASDSLNTEAAAWIKEHHVQPGGDVEKLAQLPVGENIAIDLARA